MTRKKANPLGDRVLLTVIEEKEKTAGGIIIPDSAKQNSVKKAVVEAVGPGLYAFNGSIIPVSVKEGDEVLIPPNHQGQDIKIEGKDYILLRESDILMITKS